MKQGAYLGIDPGAKGAAALWTENNKVWIHDFKDLTEAVSVIWSWVANFDIKLAALERVHVMPWDGKVSAFKFGTNYGQWRAILECARIKRIEPTPAEWKKSIPPLPIDDKKRRAIAWCIELFPGAENFLKRKLDADRAEALLLARYARDWDALNIKRVSKQGVKNVWQNCLSD